LVRRHAVRAVEILLESRSVRVLAASRHAPVNAAHLAKQPVVVGPRLEREGRIEVVLDRKIVVRHAA